VTSFASIVFATGLSREAASIAEAAAFVGSMSIVIVNVFVEVYIGTVMRMVVVMVGIVVIIWGEPAPVTGGVLVDVVVEVSSAAVVVVVEVSESVVTEVLVLVFVSVVSVSG
jgi:hypothetical protein